MGSIIKENRITVKNELDMYTLYLYNTRMKHIKPNSGYHFETNIFNIVHIFKGHNSVLVLSSKSYLTCILFIFAII